MAVLRCASMISRSYMQLRSTAYVATQSQILTHAPERKQPMKTEDDERSMNTGYKYA